MSSRAAGWIVFLMLITSGCGRSGDPGGGDDEPTPEPSGVVSPKIKDVTGTFLAGDEPAKGFELWILDHSAISYRRVPLSDSGSVILPVGGFVIDHVYTLHAVRSFILYGTLDFDPEADGTQAAVLYAGGYGFKMGEIIIPADDRGLLRPGPRPLAASLGGGFTLAGDGSPDVNHFPLPGAVERVSLASQLTVLDPSILLHSFYRSSVNPVEYARDLALHSRLGFLLDSPEVVRAVVGEAGDWLGSSRFFVDLGGRPQDAPFWSSASYALVQSGSIWTASAYSGGAPGEGAMVGLRIYLADGTAAMVPRRLERVLGRPPQVVALNASSGSTAVVDYSSDTGPNGLVRPFCQTGRVALDLMPPADVEGDPVIDGTFDQVVVEVDYFGQDSSGRSVPVIPAADEFPSTYERAASGEVNGLSWTWDPTTRRMTFLLDELDQSSLRHSIEFHQDLFPAGFGGKGLFSTRLRVYYRASDSAAEGGVAVWLDNDC